jgi:hypothetical protein
MFSNASPSPPSDGVVGRVVVTIDFNQSTWLDWKNKSSRLNSHYLTGFLEDLYPLYMLSKGCRRGAKTHTNCLHKAPHLPSPLGDPRCCPFSLLFCPFGAANPWKQGLPPKDAPSHYLVMRISVSQKVKSRAFQSLFSRLWLIVTTTLVVGAFNFAFPVSKTIVWQPQSDY